MIFAFSSTKQAIDCLYNCLYNVDILPLVKSTDIVGFCNFSVMEYQVDSTCMVFDIQPVANILSLTINRKRFTMTDIVDKQRYQLLRELIRAIVV